MLFPTRESMKRTNIPAMLAAPVGGLNASDSIMGMPKKDALVLTNFIPYPDRLETRDGSVDHATGFAKAVQHIWEYSTPSGGEKLFATTDDGIFDATAAGAIGATVMALTNGNTIAVTISTGASNYLMVVNGTDTLKQYDGTTWSSVATLGATATSDYSFVEVYRQRLFLIKKNSLIFDYLASNAISGAPTSYSTGAIFRRGGYLVAMATWTIDGGNGPEDRLVLVTSQGEVGVFVGSDPSSLSTWALVGVYFIGEPIGNRCLFKYGGDLLYLSEAGLFPLSKALMVASIDRTQAVSGKVQNLFTQAARDYGAQKGWQIISQPTVPFIMVSVPSTVQKFQFIMHAQTGAWSIFTGWDATCFARKNSELYIGVGTKILRMTGVADNGAKITARMLSAYSRVGQGRTAIIKSIKPYIQTSGVFDYKLGVSQEFNQNVSPTHIYPPGGALSSYLWGTGKFGEAYWAAGTNYVDSWQTVPDRYSPWKAVFFEVRTKSAKVAYLGAEALLAQGGSF